LAPNDLYIEIICPIAVLDEVSAENVLVSRGDFERIKAKWNKTF
jgi:hypothetical protein